MLGRYARKEGVLTLEEAVRKMTGKAAQVLSLRDRGLIQEGMHADITVFDAATILDKGTFTDPIQFPDGIAYVIVNGEVAVDHGTHTGALNGRVIRRGR